MSQSFLLVLESLLIEPTLGLTLAEGGAGGGGPTFLIFLAIIGAVFYFMVLMPGNKERNDREGMRKDLKKNDRIVTIGGIHGTVVSAPADSDDITIKLDENSPTRMKLTRSAVQTLVTNKDKDGSKDD